MELKASGLQSCVGVKPAALCQPVRKLRPANSCVCVCACVSPCVCVCVCVCVCGITKCILVRECLCVCLTWGQPGALPTAQREPSFLSMMWHLLATSKNRTRWGRPWWMVATRCVCVRVFVCVCVCHLCKDKSITHVQPHTGNLWMFKQASVCACMRNSDGHVGSQRINQLLWYGTEIEREGGKPQAFWLLPHR